MGRAATRYTPLVAEPVGPSPRERLRIAFELFDVSLRLLRRKLERQHPELSESEREAQIASWLESRPGAELGDAPGRMASWPRR